MGGVHWDLWGGTPGVIQSGLSGERRIHFSFIQFRGAFAQKEVVSLMCWLLGLIS